MAKASIVLAALLGGSQALAEDWVTVYEEDIFWLEIDNDNIRRGSDGLVYYQLKNLGKTDRAVDCQKGLIFTLKIYAGGVENEQAFPNWRNEGWAADSLPSAKAELEHVCANG